MSGIEWTDETWNPTVGCSKVSAGCKNCYAMKNAARNVWFARGDGRRSVYEDVVEMETCEECDGTGAVGGEHGPQPPEPCGRCKGTGETPKPAWNRSAVFLPERIDKPIRWTRPRRVFVDSMSDVFHRDLTFEQIRAIWAAMAVSREHQFQVLTKRPVRAREFFQALEDGARPIEQLRNALIDCVEKGWIDSHLVVDEIDDGLDAVLWPPKNVWLGVSAEDQDTADERIPHLLNCPAAVRFVSAEPLLGSIDFYDYIRCPGCKYTASDQAKHLNHGLCGQRRAAGLDWIIVGGESGHDARPFTLDWARKIVRQCDAAGCAVFVKQFGRRPRDKKGPYSLRPTELDLDDRKGSDPSEWPEELRVQEFPEAL